MNAANPTLLGGGGVDGAIHRAGGPAILAQCRAIREKEYPTACPIGQAVITTGGKLRARYVIHTVGPIYGSNNGRDAELLAACYENSIALAGAVPADEHRLPRDLDRRLRLSEERGRTRGAGGHRARHAAALQSVRQVTLVFSSERTPRSCGRRPTTGWTWLRPWCLAS